MPRRFALAAPLLLSACAPAPGPGSITAAGRDVPFTPVNLPAGLSRAEFSLFLPDTVSDAAPARGVLCVSDYATAPLYADERWRLLAARNRLAVLRHRVEKPKENNVTNVAPDADGLAGIRSALRHYAAVANRPELTDAPYVFVGLSKSAAAACMFADLAPDRTVAVIAYHPSTGRQFPRLAEGLGGKVPQLHVVSAADAILPPQLQLDYARALRAAHGPATVFLQADVAHHLTGDPAFPLAWAQAVLDRRLPPRVYPNRPTPLALVSEDDGYLGALTPDAAGKPAAATVAPFASFAGDRAAATWLPDKAVAEMWQALARRSSHEDAASTRPVGTPDDHAP